MERPEFKRVQVSARYIYELKPGDTWTTHPGGGVIVCNPESKPIWVHEVDGQVIRDVLEPAQWPEDMPTTFQGIGRFFTPG